MAQYVSAHIRREMTVNGITNTLFNGVIAWLLLKDGGPLTLRENITVDLLATAAILLFIVALIIIPLNQRKVAQGKVAASDWDNSNLLHRCLQKFPRALFGRALLFALVGLLVIAPVTAATLWLLDVHVFSPFAYAIFKGVWAGMMAGLMAWPMILLGTARPEGKQPRAQVETPE